MNKVYALIGPPGSGKTSIVKELVRVGIPRLVSHTTRPLREGEINGENYYFVDKEEFGKMELVERVTYSGYFYGLSKEEVLAKIDKFPVSVVDIEQSGLEQMKKLLAQRLESIYVAADEIVAAERMIIRGDAPDVIQRRMNYAKASGEFTNWHIADYVVKNTKSLDIAVRQVLAIMGLSYSVG